MSSTLAPAIVWPANTATPPPGWDRLTDTDGSQPTGWFTASDGAFRTVVKGYPSWDDVPWDIPADSPDHDEDEDEDYAFLSGLFDHTDMTYVFPDLPTAAGPSTHSFGNLDFCDGWQHPFSTMPGGMRQSDVLLARVLTGAKPTGLLWDADPAANVERWTAAARAAGLAALVCRDRTTRVWISPAQLSDRVNHRALRATWHAVAAGDPDRARGNQLLDVIDRGLEQAFALDLQQQPVDRGGWLQLPWWDERSATGLLVLGAVLGYPPASTYALLLGH
jgi:hypothetical protein